MRMIQKIGCFFLSLILCLCAVVGPVCADFSSGGDVASTPDQTSALPSGLGELLDRLPEAWKDPDTWNLPEDWGDPDNWNLPEGIRLPESIQGTLSDTEFKALWDDLRQLQSRSSTLSDAELRSSISDAAQRLGISLVDSQLDQLVQLMRVLELFSGPTPQETESPEETPQPEPESESAGKLGRWLRNVFQAIRDSVVQTIKKLKSSFSLFSLLRKKG